MTFTIEQTETAIRYAVAKRGRDFVNNKEVDGNGTCQYLWQDEETGARRPSCIAGVAADFLGIPHHVLEDAEGTNVVGSKIAEYFDPEAAHALWYAQQAQDNKEPWGRALVAFNRGDYNPFRR